MASAKDHPDRQRIEALFERIDQASRQLRETTDPNRCAELIDEIHCCDKAVRRLYTEFTLDGALAVKRLRRPKGTH